MDLIANIFINVRSMSFSKTEVFLPYFKMMKLSFSRNGSVADVHED